MFPQEVQVHLLQASVHRIQGLLGFLGSKVRLTKFPLEQRSLPLEAIRVTLCLITLHVQACRLTSKTVILGTKHRELALPLLYAGDVCS
jgi:hypothetical protein